MRKTADDMVQCGACGVLAFPDECECRGTLMPTPPRPVSGTPNDDNAEWLMLAVERLAFDLATALRLLGDGEQGPRERAEIASTAESIVLLSRRALKAHLAALSRPQGRGDAEIGPRQCEAFRAASGCKHGIPEEGREECNACLVIALKAALASLPSGRGDVSDAPILRQAEYLCPKCGRDILAYHQTQTLYVRQLIAEGKTTCDLTESEALRRLVDTLRSAPSSLETPQ